MEIDLNIPFINLYGQYLSIKNEIDQAITEVIRKSAYIGGQHREKFERDFANYLGVRHCIGVANGTDALTICLKVLGIGQGDEVITVANTFIATAEAITNAGAKVVFVDNDPDYYVIDPDEIEKKVTNKTKAIIPVHLHGHPADIDRILEIAHKYNIFIIEDSAQAHGAEFRGKKVGTLGTAATFSFYPGKNLGAYGDAGAIVTNDDEFAMKIKMYANHGRVSKYDHEFEGVNSRLDNIQAAVLSVKLKYLDQWNEKRRSIAEYYSRRLSDIKEIVIPKTKSYVKDVYHLYVIKAHRRDELREYLLKNGVATGIHYPIALPNLKAYQYLGHKPDDFPNATKCQSEILSLPIYPELTEENIDKICLLIHEFYRS